MRIAAKQHTITACPGSEPDPEPDPDPDPDPSSLESALRSFLSTVPEGLSRCRRSRLPPVLGSHTALVSKEGESQQERPKKKQPKLQSEHEQLKNKVEVEKMCEITRKVVCYQNSKSSLVDGDRVLGTPQKSDGTQDTPATPVTPRPRTRDYFFAHNGDIGSPWTILSPLTCSQRNSLQQNMQARNGKLSSTSGGDLDEGVWESDQGSHLSCSSRRGSQTSSSEHPPAPPDRTGHVAVSRFPAFRSVSMDETRPSPASRFRLGDLFHRGVPRRSYSSGSTAEAIRNKVVCSVDGSNHIEGQASASGIISFLRRIGVRTKPNGVEEQNFRGPKT